MPQIIYTQAAIEDLIRLREFLRTKSEDAAERAKGEIIASIKRLTSNPGAYKPVTTTPHHRDLIIKFGAAGYVARYHYERGRDITILRIKHQKEIGLEERE